MSEDFADRTPDELPADPTHGELPAETPRRAGSRARPMELARRAATQVAQLTGREAEGIAGFGKADDGWRVLVDVVEISRVPSASDVVATYEVVVDDDGELIAYDRLSRYIRGAVREE